MKQIKIVNADLNNLSDNAQDAGKKVDDLSESMDNLSKSAKTASADIEDIGQKSIDTTDSLANFSKTNLDLVETMEHVTLITNGFVGAAEVVQGSLHLMGIESEFVEESLADMMALFQISDGLKSIAEMLRSYRELKDMIKSVRAAKLAKVAVDKIENKATVANTAATVADTTATGIAATAKRTLGKATAFAASSFKKLTIAIKSNPWTAAISLILSAVTALLAWKNAADDAAESTDDLTEAQKEFQIESQKSIDKLDFELKLMQARGASTLEVLEEKANQLQKLWKETETKAWWARHDGRKKDEEEFKKQADEYYKLSRDALKELTIERAKYYADKKKKEIQDIQDEAKRKQEAAQKEWERIKQENERKIEELQKALKEELNIIINNNNNILKLKNELIKNNSKINKTAREIELEELNDEYEEKLKEQQEFLDESNNIIKKYEADPEFHKLLKEHYIEAQKFVKEYNEWKQQLTIKYNNDKNLIIKKYDAEELENLRKNTEEKIQLLNEEYDKKREIAEYNAQRAVNNENDEGLAMEKQRLGLEEQINITEEQLAKIKNMAPFEGQNKLIDELTEKIARLKNETVDLLAAEKEYHIEDQFNNLREGFDMLLEYGDGVSAKWGNVIDSLQLGFKSLDNVLKKGGKSWKNYGKLATASLNIAAGIMNAIADQQDAKSKKSFEKQKKLQIAGATMSMLAGVTGVWLSAFSPENHGSIWKRLAEAIGTSAMLITTGVLQIKKIKQTKFEGGGEEDMATAPTATALTSLGEGVNYTTNVEGASVNDTVKDTRVYVLESDITGAQNKVKITENEAVF